MSEIPTPDPTITERPAKRLPGGFALLLALVLMIVGVTLAATGRQFWWLALTLLGLIMLRGLFVLPPGVAAVVQFFGRYTGTVRTPGLHFALGIASALSSYLNLGLLLYWLHKARVYDPMPGWKRFLGKLAIANAAMAAVLLLGLHFLPEFTTMGTWTRVAWLAALVVGGGAVYAVAMVALAAKRASQAGWRRRDPRVARLYCGAHDRIVPRRRGRAFVPPGQRGLHRRLRRLASRPSGAGAPRGRACARVLRSVRRARFRTVAAGVLRTG